MSEEVESTTGGSAVLVSVDAEEVAVEAMVVVSFWLGNVAGCSMEGAFSRPPPEDVIVLSETSEDLEAGCALPFEGGRVDPDA